MVPNELLVICFLVVTTYLILIARRNEHDEFDMRLVRVDDNESLVMEASFESGNEFFVVDTGYAGPLVLSETYLSRELQHDDPWSQLKHRYEKATHQSNRMVTTKDRKASLGRFVSKNAMMAYSTGCRMKLAGVTGIVEHRSNMITGAAVRFRCAKTRVARTPMHKTNHDSDLFVTHPLPGSTHLLTSDYLRDASPCLLNISDSKLQMRMSTTRTAAEKGRMMMQPTKIRSGAFVITVLLNNTPFDVVLDTGSSGTFSIGSNHVSRLQTCVREHRTVRQNGVSGNVCADIVRCDLAMNGIDFGEVSVFLNDGEFNIAHGYVGLGVLRGFDILISDTEIGLRRNELPLRDSSSYATPASGSCGERMLCAT